LTSCSLRIRAVLWFGTVLWAAAVLPPARVPDAWGQGVNIPIGGVQQVDTTTGPGWKWAPLYTGRVTGNVTSMSLLNDIRFSSPSPWGTTFIAGLSGEKRVFRQIEREENNHQLNGTVAHVFFPGFTADVTFSDNRSFSQVIAVTGGLQEFVLNNQSLVGSVAYRRLLGAFRWDVRGSGSMLDSEKTFKSDASQLASVNGGASYRFFDGLLRTGVRGAYKRNSETSKTGLASYGGLGGTEDSLSTSVRAHISDSLTVAFDYIDYSGERRYTDQARGSLGSQQVGEENVFEERQITTSRSYDLRLNARPVRGFDVKMGATRTEQVNDYIVTKTRYSRTLMDLMDASIAYLARWGSKVTLGLENRQTLRDLGPQSIASYDEETKVFDLDVAHAFSQSLRMTAAYQTTLRQYFYLDYAANPRDRDQLDNLVRLDVTSAPFPKFNVSIGLSWTQTDFINIDASQSEGNRVKSRYDLRPGFTYRLNNRLTIVQNYGLALEFTDFTFQETDNFLDRNVTFSNEFRVVPTSNLQTKFYYALTLHDRGSYLPLEPGGERFLTVDTEDRRDQIALGFKYKMGPHLSLEADYDYSHKVDRAVGGVGSDRITEDGGIEGGIVAKRDWGSGRSLNLKLKRAKRHGAFISEAQQDFWIMNGELRYTF